MTRIAHSFDQWKGIPKLAREIGGEGDNRWLIGCTCDNCREAQARYVPPEPEPEPEPERETFEEYWERTLPERKRACEKTWQNNERMKLIELAKQKK